MATPVVIEVLQGAAKALISFKADKAAAEAQLAAISDLLARAVKEIVTAVAADVRVALDEQYMEEVANEIEFRMKALSDYWTYYVEGRDRDDLLTADRNATELVAFLSVERWRVVHFAPFVVVASISLAALKDLRPNQLARRLEELTVYARGPDVTKLGGILLEVQQKVLARFGKVGLLRQGLHTVPGVSSGGGPGDPPLPTDPGPDDYFDDRYFDIYGYELDGLVLEAARVFVLGDPSTPGGIDGEAYKLATTAFEARQSELLAPVWQMQAVVESWQQLA